MKNSDEVKNELSEFIDRIQIMTNKKSEGGLFSSFTSFFGAEKSLKVKVCIFHSFLANV